ncbi:hypothetical protein [Subtercola sp. RTI3]|uniref:hypothetical protein n=1 Tax=Subtercola sp. RTI3 TaxID=3048639 RepID=UPI002B229FAD|nr:hypothetical protein [Subtercola sp. RTI3]MEA9984389.1 hypothetical protein [Subtercola sp. RTI3]
MSCACLSARGAQSAAGIQTPTSELMTVSGRSVLVLGRFDRHGDTRIGYASAMTLVEFAE